MAQATVFDAIIKNGLYFDGSLNPASIKHIGIKNGLVAEVSDSPLDETGCNEIIDAEKRWVTPGFIEPHSHYDAEVIIAPELKESVRHGVTTVTTGICSISMVSAPADDCSDLFTRVEAVPRDIVLPLVREKKTWTGPVEFRRFYQQHPLGPNLAAFIGHSDIRASVMGLERSTTKGLRPSAEEMQQMENILEEALDAGFLGMSSMTTKIDRVDGDRAWSRPLPSTFATWKEYRALNRILRRRGRILQSAPDAVGKINIVMFFWEAMSWFRKQLKTTLLTVLDLKSQPRLQRLGPIAGWLANTFLRANFRWQFLPSPLMVYADGLDFGPFQEFTGGEILWDLKEFKYEKIKDPEFRALFKKGLNATLSKGVWDRNFADAWVVDCPDASLIGKNFGEISKAQNKAPADAFLDLMEIHKDSLRWGVYYTAHRVQVMRRLIGNRQVHVGFADSGAHLRNLAAYNFPIRLLKYVLDSETEGKACVSREFAIHRLTGELADWYGLDAGYIRVGDRADLVVLNPNGIDDGVWNMQEEYFAPFDTDRMVNRNDDAIEAVFINGNKAYDRNQGFADDLGKTQRFGRFLPATINPVAEEDSRQPLPA